MIMAVGREPADAGPCRCQQPQFRPHQVASADQQHRTGLQIEKYRQKSHATLASPTCGVDWNYFLYMSRSSAAKRKLFLLYCSATIEFSPPNAKGQRCIFSTTTPPKISCTAQAPPSDLRPRKFWSMGTPMRRPWITRWTIWTRSRPRASTFSGKPSHG